MCAAQVAALSATSGAWFWLRKSGSSALRAASSPLDMAVPTRPAAKPTAANTAPCRGAPAKQGQGAP
jgi:hypothetical protein